MMVNVGTKIKKLRELKNLTQEHVAERLGLTQSGYSKIENGEVDLPYSRLQNIADILEIKVEDITSFDEKFVFNNLHTNNQNGGQIGVIHNHVSDAERKLYESQITSLKDEVAHLKVVMEKLLK
jgi:transcriptional regulator with XRE-family HTH domain